MWTEPLILYLMIQSLDLFILLQEGECGNNEEVLGDPDSDDTKHSLEAM